MQVLKSTKKGNDASANDSSETTVAGFSGIYAKAS